jgi:hypothetical protein
MVFQLIPWVDLRRSLSTCRILKNMMLLLQTGTFLHLQATLLKAVKLHPHRGQQLARSQGWTVSLHNNLFLRNCVGGRERKLDGAAKKMGEHFQNSVENCCKHPPNSYDWHMYYEAAAHKNVMVVNCCK